jgi:opacity protein-like surface antigen
MGVIMQLRFAVAVRSIAIALPLASVSAQTTTPSEQTTTTSAQSTTPATARWEFSLGVDPTAFDLNTPEPGINARMVANLTRSWQSGNSRWARHISLMVGGDAPHDASQGLPSLFGLPQCACSMHLSRRYAGLTAGASYDLFRVSRFTPYLSGGTGLYYSEFGRSTDGALTPGEIAVYGRDFTSNNFSLGVNAGLGLKVRFGSHELFIEQMVHDFNVRPRYGSVAIAPLNIGIRF